MGRCLLLIVAFVVSAPVYLFSNSTHLPSEKHVQAAGPDAVRVASNNSAPANHMVGHASTNQTRSSRDIVVGQGQFARPGKQVLAHMVASHSDGPPRHSSHKTARKQPFLNLPAVLPNRVLNVPILMYHHVSSIAAATALNYGLTVTDAGFAAQLSYLAQHHYHTVLLRQVFEAMYHGAPLPSHPIVLTFDDGYLDNYTDALPILRRYHDVAEFNIISAFVGNTVGINSYMTWPQLKTLVTDGMEIGSHTVDHQDLGIVPLTTLRAELRDSRNLLQQRLGVPVQFIAYPSGEPFRHGDVAAEQRVLSLVPMYGYVGGLMDGPITSSSHDARMPFKLWRIRVSGGENIAAYAASLPA